MGGAAAMLAAAMVVVVAEPVVAESPELRVGISTTGNVSASVTLAGPSPAASQSSIGVAAGSDHTCAWGDGKAYCWGWGHYGQLGDGDTVDQSKPVAVDAPAGVTFTQLTAGDVHTCGLGSDARAYCWGWGHYGQLGDGGTTDRLSPVAVNAPAGVTFTQLAAGGDHHTCGLGSDAKAYCWGAGESGRLGNGDTANQSSPVAVNAPAGVTFTQLAGGYSHTCALGGDAKAYCWGLDESGQLGNGDTVDQSKPVTVNAPAGVTFTQLTAGGQHTCGLGSDAKAYCWGNGFAGQLGNGDTANQSKPVAVDRPAGVTFIQLAAGFSYTCGLGSDTKAYCWGEGGPGKLGNGDTVDQSKPVAVNAPAGVTFTRLVGGMNHTCGLGTNTMLYCWGSGGSGQLGTGDTGDQSSPVAVVLLGTPPVGPRPPANVAVMPGDRQIKVSWTAPSDLGDGTLTGYTAAASPGGNACTSMGARTCTISGLTNGVPYTVTVITTTTVGASAESKPSASATPTAPPPAAPKPPTGVTAEPGDRAVTVSWTPADLGDDALVRYTATASPGGKTWTTSSSHGTTCTINGLTNGTLYTVTVTTTTKAGTSNASDPSEPVTPGAVPLPPTGVISGPGDRAVTVSWTPADLGDDALVRYTATASPSGKTCTTTSSSHGTTCTIDGLTNGTSYTVTVTTTTKAGTSNASDPSEPVTPNAGPPPPGLQPPVITGAEPEDESITVSWRPGRQGSGTLLGYTATATAANSPCRSTTTPCIGNPTTQPAGTTQLAAATQSASCSTTDAKTCAITGLTNGASYVVTVVTHTTAGDSSSTSPRPAPSTPTATPAPAPSLPTTGTPTVTITITAWLLITAGTGLALLSHCWRRRSEPTRQAKP